MSKTDIDQADLTPPVRQLIPARPVRKAHEQVADHIRGLVMTGQLTPEERLPTEETLASGFGVSRATVREALRTLSAEHLIRTAKGSHGGSFVTIPTAEHISASFGANLHLLSHTDLPLEDFLELREVLEVPAARFAAERRSRESLEKLRAAMPDDPVTFGTETNFAYNRTFHAELVEAAGNKLLAIAAVPIFTVLQTHHSSAPLGADFHRCVYDDHSAILDAIERRQPDKAADHMREHLHNLRPTYEHAWRSQRRQEE